MKHGVKKGKRFGRPVAQRKAMFHAMIGSLVQHEEITTTTAKAKELARIIAPFITRAKEPTVANRRLLGRHLPEPVVKKLVEELGPRYKERPGGYTRITRLRPRKNDNAPMAKIELV